MKIYSFFSDSHSVFFHRFFKPSFLEVNSKNLLSIEAITLPQRTDFGEYMSGGWVMAMIDKVRAIKGIIRKNFGDFVVFSDVDVQFFSGFPEDILSRRDPSFDILFQDDTPKQKSNRAMCAGFALVNCNQKSENFYSKVLELIPNEGAEQIAVNKLGGEIAFGFLPSDKYYTIASATNHSVWDGQTEFSLPSNILMHHANWTKGVENKLKLLELVRCKVFGLT